VSERTEKELDREMVCELLSVSVRVREREGERGEKERERERGGGKRGRPPASLEHLY